MRVLNLEIELFNHASIKIRDSKIIYIDPFQITEQPNVEKADVVLISHPHYDHCSPDDIKMISNENTIIVTVADCQSKLNGIKAKEVKLIEPGKTVMIDNIKITGVPAYNIDKFRAPGLPYHPKENNWVGFIIELDNEKVYFAGDTDIIPEMKEIDVDIALLPVGGTYTMTADEAAEATKMLKRCEVAVPMHYGTIVGSASDAETFKEKAGCKVIKLM